MFLQVVCHDFASGGSGMFSKAGRGTGVPCGCCGERDEVFLQVSATRHNFASGVLMFLQVRHVFASVVFVSVELHLNHSRKLDAHHFRDVACGNTIGCGARGFCKLASIRLSGTNCASVVTCFSKWCVACFCKWSAPCFCKWSGVQFFFTSCTSVTAKSSSFECAPTPSRSTNPGWMRHSFASGVCHSVLTSDRSVMFSQVGNRNTVNLRAVAGLVARVL